MLDTLVDALAWTPPLLVFGGYLATRRSLPRSRSLLLFDCVAVTVAVLICCSFYWREITGRVPAEVWVEERLWLPVMVPIWLAIISVPFFLFAAAIRYFIFSRA